MRPGENHGEHYFFVTEEEFKSMIASGDFIEHACVFGNYYGTSGKVIKQILASGVDVFLDIDWQGAQQVRKRCLKLAVFLFCHRLKKSFYRRLRGRGQDSEEVIAKRMSQAVSEMEHFNEYDYLLINDDFNTALADLQSIIRSEKLRLDRQTLRHGDLIQQIIGRLR